MVAGPVRAGVARRRLGADVVLFDLAAGLVALLVVLTSLLVALREDWRWTPWDWVGLALLLAALPAFVGFRRRAYAAASRGLLLALAAPALAVVVIFGRRWGVLAMGLSALLVLAGALARSSTVADLARLWSRAGLAAAGAAVVLALALMELALRLLPGLVSGEAQQAMRASPDRYGVAHPYIGHLHTPGARVVVAGTDFRAVHRTDGHGFRNTWPWPARAEIVALGDSVTFGHGVEDGEAWPSLLAAGLPGTRVVNMGMDGAAPQQYLRVYETFGAALQPRLVIVGFFPRNDFWDAGMFERWREAGAGGNYMVWRDFGRPRYTGLSARAPVASLVETLRWRALLLARRSYLVNLLLHVQEAVRAGGAAAPSFRTADGGRVVLQPGDFARKTEGARPGRREFALVLDALARIQARARAQGAEVLAVLLPSKEETYLPLLGQRVPDAAGRLRAAAEALGIACLDLRPAFHERAARGEKLFFEIDGHPNARGQALIAEGVRARLAGRLDLGAPAAGR